MARRGTHKRTGKEEAVIVLGATGDGKPAALIRNLVNGALDQLGIRVDDVMQEVIDEVGEEAAAKLRESSPKRKGKSKHKYAKGWIYDPGKTYRNKKVAMVRNKNQPQLTHILEFGHPIVKKSKVVGNAPAQEHIKPVNDWAQQELVKRYEKRMNDGG